MEEMKIAKAYLRYVNLFSVFIDFFNRSST